MPGLSIGQIGMGLGRRSAGGGGPPPYNPSTDLAGYLFAIQPWNIGTLFTDTAGTVAVTAPGDLVACVRDPFNNAIVATQATSGNRPIYQVDGDGLPYLQLGDGVTPRWFVTGTLTFNTDSINRLIYCVAARQDARPAANTRLLSHIAFTLFAPEINNTHSATHRVSSSVSAQATFSGTPPLKELYAAYATAANDLIRFRRNKAQVAQSVSDPGAGFYGNGVLAIGSTNTGADPFNGRLYGMAIGRSATTDYTDTDIVALENYLDARLNP